jgi:hypothetical protein
MFSLPFLKEVTESGSAVAALPTLCDRPRVVRAGFRWGKLTSAAWVVACTVEFPQNLIINRRMRNECLPLPSDVSFCLECLNCGRVCCSGAKVKALDVEVDGGLASDRI